MTSAIRDAANGLEVLDRVRERTGVDLQVLTGEDEARLTFLAVRRWFGWSAGQLLVLDIGGGSLELASGIDEDPDVALSLPLGAGRMTRRFLRRPGPAAARTSPRWTISRTTPTDLLAPAGEEVARRRARRTWSPRPARPSAPWPGSPGPLPTRPDCRRPAQLTLDGLDQLVGFVSRIESAALAELRGVSPDRAHQVPAGAVVAATAMRLLDVPCVRICPWALREGVILRRLDSLGGA